MTSKNMNGSLTCTYWSSLFVSRNYDPVYWDSDDPNNENISMLVIHNFGFHRDYDPVYWDSDDPNIDNLSVFVIHNICF